MDWSKLDQLLDNDPLGLLKPDKKKTEALTHDERLIESFEELQRFRAKNGHEPQQNFGNMTETNLYLRLKHLREDVTKHELLRPYDEYGLLSSSEEQVPVEESAQTLDDLLEHDPFGLLNDVGDTSIHDFKYVPKPSSNERAETDKIAQRRTMSDEEYAPFEKLFKQVQSELKSGARKLVPFKDPLVNIKAGRFYVSNGILCYLNDNDLTERQIGNTIRKDGRVDVIFENRKRSDMYFSTLWKNLFKGGYIVTVPDDNSIVVDDNVDEHVGYIYIARSLCQHPLIAGKEHLYKVGRTTQDPRVRPKGAKKESTFLFHKVEIIQAYRCYNLNLEKAETLLHHFFANAQLNVYIESNGISITPKEWYEVPLQILERGVELLMNGQLNQYIYDHKLQEIRPKS